MQLFDLQAEVTALLKHHLNGKNDLYSNYGNQSWVFDRYFRNE